MKHTDDKALANLHIRLPASEKAAFEREAKRRRLSLTTWVRLTLLKAAGLYTDRR